jgi:DNA-binding protein H-NS
MAKASLSTMDVQSLMDLRKRVDQRLRECRADIEKQLTRLDRSIGDETIGLHKGRVSSLRGRKVPPKYRGPSGETWAGRGARPRWIVAAIKEGKKLDDFLIDKSSRRGTEEKAQGRSVSRQYAVAIYSFAASNRISVPSYTHTP